MNYYVNSQVQANGDHEVHQETGCPFPAAQQNRKQLGYHADCHSAVRAARSYYTQVNGCAYCCKPCHTQ
jgi:hypothetical protein